MVPLINSEVLIFLALQGIIPHFIFLGSSVRVEGSGFGV